MDGPAARGGVPLAWETAPRYLLRDRDAVYGVLFSSRVQSLGIREVKTAPRAPWQNPYVERVISSIWRDCLDHMIVLGQVHLPRILAAYLRYYHEARPHLCLERNAPTARAVEPPSKGKVIALPHLGNLHHRYARAA